MQPTRREIKQYNELLETLTGKKDIDDCEYLGKAPRRNKQHEQIEMEELFKWVFLQEKVHQELKLLYHIPNERKDAMECKRLSRQGVRSGVPDLCLPVPRRGFNGLYIELKAGKNKATENQEKWIDALNAQGYNAGVCTGWKQAADCIMWYLGISKSINFEW